MTWHFKDGRIITTREEQLLEVAALARVVQDEMPEATITRRIRRGMQLCNGTMNPTDLLDALQRIDGSDQRQRPDQE